MRRSWVWLAVCSIALLTIPLPLASQEYGGKRFYLSTSKIFSPGETPAVRLEARAVKTMEFRVYRIPDPFAFFKEQKQGAKTNPHAG